MINKIYLGIGSNVDRVNNIKSCLNMIRELYGDIQISPVYETKSMGFDGPNFYNLVCYFQANIDIHNLNNILKKIENKHGRNFNETKFSSRTIDIDILYYDDLICDGENIKLPRDEILKYDFVLRPLVDIAPHYIHPEKKITNKKIMDTYKIQQQIIGKVDLNLNE
ncbi:MAG: 2-amino-4-hydroxy-6-hydroxymethyldihydropteridine diphosphokinase [Gammaproteobacteria bacterium]|nr:2-amino-4-hydroxy-6-hydroxymethyldihydropteridine diphosphokinase [Gammaproteobacteria bacterium]|tara:strand:+ start:1664 stop:2161 length:498 start_codon:yes stop_codon:yes gene_type:complete